jgi:hypothetical protein
MGNAAWTKFVEGNRLHQRRGPTMRKMKLFGLAFALATGAFVLTMLKDPPRSVASAATPEPGD